MWKNLKVSYQCGDLLLTNICEQFRNTFFFLVLIYIFFLIADVCNNYEYV